MADPAVTIERTFDGNYAVFVNGHFRFSGDEASCHRWVSAVLTRPAQSAAQRDAMLARAIGR